MFCLPSVGVCILYVLLVYASGKVIKVEAEGRIGKDNFVVCLRKSLEAHFGESKVRRTNKSVVKLE